MDADGDMKNPGNAFQLMDGTVLHGTSRVGGAVAWPSREVQCAEEAMFAKNAHFLLANRERIFADAKLFLTPVRIMSGLAYGGALPMPCIGGYLEWWLNAACASKGEGEARELVYFISGSPLSGTSASLAVKADGTRCKCDARLLALADSFVKVMRRYGGAMRSLASYTLEEALRILNGGQVSFERSLDRIVLERRVLSQAREIAELKNTVARQDACIAAYAKALARAVVRENPDEVRRAIEQADAERRKMSPSENKGGANRPVAMLFRAFARREGVALSAPSRQFLLDELAKCGEGKGSECANEIQAKGNGL